MTSIEQAPGGVTSEGVPCGVEGDSGLGVSEGWPAPYSHDMRKLQGWGGNG